jgi:3-isopropylmalate/(R)-2-methylmalate dehydratase small subunit
MNTRTKIIGQAVPLLDKNIDTDVIIPQTELITVSKKGLGKGLFARWRYHDDYQLNENFILNNGCYKSASIILAGENFGCGSSREHAVWALLDYGIKCVIAPSFGEIFYNNSYKNGLILIKCQERIINQIATLACSNENNLLNITIDLEKSCIFLFLDHQFPFDMESRVRDYLINDLDEIKESLLLNEKIESFQKVDRKKREWSYFSF